MKKLILLLTISIGFSVGEAGAIFLLISPSPTMNGFGGSGVSMISNDAYSVHYNPALSPLQSGFSFTSSNCYTQWLPNLADGIFNSSNIKQIGYNGYSYKNLKLQFALTWYNTDLNLGQQVQTDAQGNELGNFNSSMKADATSFSLGIQFKDRPIYLSLGRTNKTAIQKLGPGAGSEDSNGYSKDKLYDLGFRFLVNNHPFLDNNKIGLTFALGYSKSNIGDFIRFQDYAQADPAPMTARLGLTWGGKISLLDGVGIELKFVNEAEDLLVETLVDSVLINDEMQYEYERVYQKGLLGDINITDHIIDGDAVDEVTIHRGFELSFLDIYYIREGQFIDEPGKIDVSTEGFGINISNLFTTLPLFMGDNFPLINNIFNYVDIQFNSSKWDEEQGHPLENTYFDEYTFTLKNIDNLIKGNSLMNISPNINLIGGMTLSKWVGNDIDVSIEDEIEYLNGFKFGIEEISQNNRIMGLTYSQRGVDFGQNGFFKANYFSGYYLFPKDISDNLTLLLGGEMGLFYNGEIESCYSESCETEKLSFDEYEGEKFDYGLIIGAKIPLNSEISLIGNYYFSFADFYEDIDIQNRSIQFYLSYGL